MTSSWPQRRNEKCTGKEIRAWRPSRSTYFQSCILFVFDLCCLQGKSLQEMKMSIGEQLYYLIQADHPESAGKLTGMFLEATDSVDDLALLLFSPSSLKLLLTQAFDVLSVSFLPTSK